MQSLSRREREVAQFVAAGLTNKEVAQRLSLSERTVEGHVASICNKLGFRSRVQIASWVSQGAPPPTPAAARFRRDRLPSGWILVAMVLGAPLPFVAIVYQTLQPGSALVNVLVVVAAVAFIAVPALVLAGLGTGRAWPEKVAEGGLVFAGTLAIVAGIVATDLSGHQFRAAGWFEAAYAGILLPLLALHVAAGLGVALDHPWRRPLVSAVAAVWILRFGYGLTLAVVVLWLEVTRRRSRRSGSDPGC